MSSDITSETRAQPGPSESIECQPGNTPGSGPGSGSDEELEKQLELVRELSKHTLEADSKRRSARLKLAEESVQSAITETARSHEAESENWNKFTTMQVAPSAHLPAGVPLSFKVTPIAGDGNCAFRALVCDLKSHDLFATLPDDADVTDDHTKLRRFICKYINNLFLQEAWFRQLATHHIAGEDGIETWDDYVQYMRKPGVYASSLELFATAIVFNTRVFIVSHDGIVDIATALPHNHDIALPSRLQSQIDSSSTSPIYIGHVNLSDPEHLTSHSNRNHFIHLQPTASGESGVLNALHNKTYDNASSNSTWNGGFLQFSMSRSTGTAADFDENGGAASTTAAAGSEPGTAAINTTNTAVGATNDATSTGIASTSATSQRTCNVQECVIS
jgi:OTU-like cysteine protease